MLRNQVFENVLSQMCLYFNIENVDEFFPGFALGYFVVLCSFSSVQRLYLYKDVPKRETKVVLSKLASFIRGFTQENWIIVIIIYLRPFGSKWRMFFNETILAQTNFVELVKHSRHGRQFVLEKHPCLRLRKVDFPSENLTLVEFLEA